jgi:two-component system chemotaxis sensor kinase CheA
MKKTPITLDEDLRSLISECREILDDIEPRLVGLGDLIENHQHPDDETVNLIFRGFHTIKGTAAFYQLDDVVSVAHKAETLLEYFRSHCLSMNPSITDLLCDACDVIASLLDDLEAQDDRDDHADELKSLLSRLNGRIDRCTQSLDVQCGADRSNRSGSTDPSRSLPIKIGKQTRIFVTECRKLIDEMDGFESNRGWTTSRIARAREIVDAIFQGAAFLGFDRVGLILSNPRAVLDRLEQRGTLPGPDEEAMLHDTGEQLTRIIGLIDATGHDLPFDEAGEEIGVADGSTRRCDEQGVLSDDLLQLYCQDVLETLAMMETCLMSGDDNADDRHRVSDIKDGFHRIRSSSGMADQPDLEQLAECGERIFERVADVGTVLDDWDRNAVWYVLSEIRSTLATMEQGGSGMVYKKAALIHIIEQIGSGRSLDDKRHDIHLPRHPEGKAPMPVPEQLPPRDPGATVPSSEPDTPVRTGERRQVERRDIRVNIETLDELINLVGELVIAENMVIRNPDLQNLELENFEKAGAHLHRIIRDLQDVALAVRMIPIDVVFRKMIRLVHDLSVKSGKKVTLTIIGEDTEIDKTVAELISDPLVHLIRNAIDHGIRKKSDEPDGAVDGRITLEARHDGGEVLVIVSDDGMGLDTEKIFQTAVSRGIVDETREPLTQQDIHSLIFHPGFSTRDTITDLSGRGVGMDVVKQNMEKIKGHIHVQSQPGRGTTVILGIPLTLAIIDGMLVRVGQTCFTIPLLSIRETIQAGSVTVASTMDGQQMILQRGHLVPLIHLDRLYGFEQNPEHPERELIVVVEYQNEAAGFLIDEMIGEQQTVIKALSGYMDQVKGISGCTILGDGEVSLILDVGGVIEKAQAFGWIPQPLAI